MHPTSTSPDFVVVANRLPVDRVVVDGSTQWRTAPGGLVTALESVLKQRRGAWVGWPGSPDEDLAPFEVNGISLIPVALSAEEIEEYYEGFSNATLWPLYHDSVAFPEFHRVWWDSYVRVNRRFAQHCADIAAENGTVWVQDYQLQLVPKFLRELRPDLKIGFFLHIPFPPIELFAQLPWRAEIVDGLLGADLIGFQVSSAAQNFVRLARQHLGFQARGEMIMLTDRVAFARAYPISIDSHELSELAGGEEVAQAAAKFRTDLGDPKRILLGVDRLDYTKGLRHRIRAIGELFSEGRLNPEEDVFVQVASPSRENVGEYMRLRDDIELLVGRINGDAGRLGRPPIVYLHTTYPRLEMAAMYRATDVMVVTPLRDGMNLVCKEYVACKNDDSGALVLSEFAGAAHELKQSYLVNPYDLNGMKRQIMQAVAAPAKERRRRMRGLRRQVFEHDIQVWADRFLGDLSEVNR